MLKLITVLSLILSTTAFNFGGRKPITQFKYVGDTKPLDYFDPMQITSNSPNDLVKFVREGELQNGRIAMFAFVSLVGIELATGKPGVTYLSSLDGISQIPFWFSFGFFEYARLNAGWQNPFAGGSAFKLEKDYQPGNVFNVPEDKYDEKLMNIELNNGRLAMIGTLGFIAQELVTKSMIF